MATRSLMRGGVGAVLAILLFAVLALANYLSATQFFHRFDLTRNDEYTVSPASRQVLAGLPDVVNVKVYFSRNLPEQAASIPTRVRDLLTDLQSYAGGALKVEYVDPTESPETEQRVVSMGIPKVPLTVLEKSRQDTREVFLGIAILYRDDKQVIPAVLDDRSLEYEIVSRIVKLTGPEHTVGFLAAGNALSTTGDLTVAAELLRRQYQVQDVDLAGGKPVPDAVTTLIVPGPKGPLDERVRYEIDQFLMRGGNVLFLLDMFDIDLGTLMARPVDTGLQDQLASYGVRVEPSLVADWGMNATVQMPGGPQLAGMQTYYLTPYPYWPKLVPQYLSDSHPVVSQLSGAVLPWTAPLRAVKDAGDRFEVVELARTTEFAVAEREPFTVNPRSLREPAEHELTQLLVAAAVTGPQTSFFAGKPVPPATTAAGEAPEPPSPVPAARRESTERAQIIVVGGSDFVTDAMARQREFGPNLVLFLNAVDWLTMGDQLIGIRSRSAPDPLLDPGKREIGERLAPWINIALVPLLVAALGIAWRAARRRRRVAFA